MKKKWKQKKMKECDKRKINISNKPYDLYIF